MESLSDLMQAAVARLDMNGRQLADYAAGHGHKIDRTSVYDLIADRYRRSPHASTVRAIAFLAGVSESRAFKAAGLTPPGKPFAAELHDDADWLDREQRRAVNELIRLLAAARKMGLSGGSGRTSLALVADEPEQPIAGEQETQQEP